MLNELLEAPLASDAPLPVRDENRRLCYHEAHMSEPIYLETQ